MGSERPIIMSAPMVRALLAGRKSQTRRLIRDGVPPTPSMEISPRQRARHPRPYLDSYCGAPRTSANPRGMTDRWCWWTRDDRQGLPTFGVPYVPGDRLWVREAWQAWSEYDKAKTEDLPSEMRERINRPADGNTWDSRIRPSIHMPRWASRLTLVVTDVRVERLQEISAADTVAEGVECDTCEAMGQSACHRRGCFASRQAFERLWNSLHGPDAWDANPWIAVITFRPIPSNIDAVDKAPSP